MANSNSFLLCALLIFVSQWRTVRGQTPSPYASLAPTPFINKTDGTFIWPQGEGASAFTEGSLMNISWTTSYPSVNLWLIVNQSWDSPISIVCE